MKSQNNFKHIEHKDCMSVISFNTGATFRISNFMEQINRLFRESVLNNLQENLKQINLGIPPFHKTDVYNIHGVDAEILEPESGKWKKGRIRMRVILEFCPDEPEEIKNDILQPDSNSLDDIRRTIS